MGYMTLAEISDEVSLNIGGKAPAPERLTRWINWGYINLATYSRMRFPEIETSEPFNVFDGVNTYPVPTDPPFLGLIKIELRDTSTDPDTSHKTLQKMKREFFELADEAQPTHYKRRGTDFIVWPTPDQLYEGYIVYMFTPTALSNATDVTIFDASWDVAIVMLGTHHALLSLGRSEEADKWLGRFLGYASSRLKAIDIEADMPKGGLNVAWEREDIQDVPADLQD